VHIASNTCVYSPETLKMLCLVFNQSLSTLTGAAGFSRDSVWREEVGIHIAKVIISGYAEGERDPIRLRRKALTAVALAYVQTTGVHRARMSRPSAPMP
jgi:hypothetical protein